MNYSQACTILDISPETDSLPAEKRAAIVVAKQERRASLKVNRVVTTARHKRAAAYHGKLNRYSN